jgi:hypothetical protein
MNIHFLPAWLTADDISTLAQWLVLAEQNNWRYTIHPRSDLRQYAIIDISTDQYIEAKPKHIWSSPSMDDAVHFAASLNRKTKTPPKEELSLSQKIMYINATRKNDHGQIQPNPFHQCDKCGNNVRDGHTC